MVHKTQSEDHWALHISMSFTCVVCATLVHDRHHALECEPRLRWQQRLDETGISIQEY